MRRTTGMTSFAAVPFQLMFFLGFAFVSGMSLKHAFLARRVRAEG